MEQIKRGILVITAICFAFGTFAQAPTPQKKAVHQPANGAFSVVASPAENSAKGMNFSWATETDVKTARLEVTEVNDTRWKKSIGGEFQGVLCTTFDGMYSRTAAGENIYEDIVFNKYNASVGGLKSGRDYKYRVIAGGDTSQVRYFKSSGRKEWSACVIADFHAYPPVAGRTEAAMDMIGVVEKWGGPIDCVLHLGDIIAWGGSYSFWEGLYNEEPFKRYMWAGVNGNHDNMDRTNKRNTNQFFRHTAAYPENGYPGEEGVCYWFKYGDVLFIMLNNESMRQEEGLQAAQKWVREVVRENPAAYTVVCEHYQWFFGATGKDSQYPRWSGLFDELGVDLALAGNNHIYVSTHPLKGGKVVDGSQGTVYIQTVSTDNDRGSECNWKETPEFNADKIKFRWSEGARTVGAMHLKVEKKKMVVTLLDRDGNVLDTTEVLKKKK